MQHIAPSHRPQQPKHLWRNDITGLRAIAVLPVLLFHAFPDLLPGGFFGVDVFFVISGYLISGIIFRGILDGSFSYRIFYEKRIKRIVPNLLLLICFVSVMGYFSYFLVNMLIWVNIFIQVQGSLRIFDF